MRGIIWVLGTGFGMIIGLISGLIRFSAEAASADLFVSPLGRDEIPLGGLYLINDCKYQTDPCRTIQHAIHKAQEKDTIHVASGIYTNTGTSVITLTKTIAVMGGWDGGESSPPIHNSMLYPTILDGERARQVVAMLGDYSPTLDGFIIRNGYAHGSINNGGGIYISGSAPWISSNRIENNVATYYGGGIYISGEIKRVVTLMDNEIISNTATYGGGGVEVTQNITVSMISNVISENTSNYGGGMEIDQANLDASRNFITNNHSSSAIIISGNTIRSEFINNVIMHNQGDAMDIRNSQLELIHNTIVTNSGAAISSKYNSVFTITNNLIAYNARGVDKDENSFLSGLNNLFWRNGSNVFTGTNAIEAEPILLSDGFHLSSISPAIDHGFGTDIDRDIDGDERPNGLGFDIGADEWWTKVFLPLISKK